MNNDATLNAAAGVYEGMDRFEARKQLWRDMKVRLGAYAAAVKRHAAPLRLLMSVSTTQGASRSTRYCIS